MRSSRFRLLRFPPLRRPTGEERRNGDFSGSCFVRFRALVLSALLGYLAGGAGLARGAEMTLRPTLSVSEEYNDNVFMTTNDPKGDFITRIAPGLNLEYKAPLWDWWASANINYLHFARGTEGDQIYPAVSIIGNTRLIDNFLYLDLTDSYRRIPLNTGYDSMFAHQANQNFFTVSPYLKFHPQPRLEFSTGYVYKNVLYDQPLTVDWQEHDLFLRATHEMTPRSSSFVNATYAYTTTSNNIHYSRVTPSVGMDYLYAVDSRIHLEGGYNFLFTDDGSSFASPYWNVGINYPFGSWDASLKGGVEYNTDPTRNITERRSIVGGLTRNIPRGTIGVSPYYYTTRDYITDQDSQRSYGISLISTYKFHEKLEGHLTLTAGEEWGTTFIDPHAGLFINQYANPYYLLSVDSGVTYVLNNDLTLFFSYLYRSYIFTPGNSANATSNRVIIGLTKSFQGLSF
jgi:hypothetical protein